MRTRAAVTTELDPVYLSTRCQVEEKPIDPKVLKSKCTLLLSSSRLAAPLAEHDSKLLVSFLSDESHSIQYHLAQNVLVERLELSIPVWGEHSSPLISGKGQTTQPLLSL